MTPQALIGAFRDGLLTRDELFARLTDLVATESTSLSNVLGALVLDASARSDFESWLLSLTEDAPAVVAGDKRVNLTPALLAQVRARATSATPARAVFPSWYLPSASVRYVATHIDVGEVMAGFVGRAFARGAPKAHPFHPQIRPQVTPDWEAPHGSRP